MDAGFERRALALFLELAELDESEKEHRLGRLAASELALAERVRELLRGDAAAAAVLKRPLLEAGSGIPGGDADGLEPVLDPGTEVSGCRLVRVVGEGAMGVVYEARQGSPGRRVAVKVLKSGLSTRRSVRRFELEVEALGRLDHPGIARILAAGTIPGPGGSRPYLVMEFVDGFPVTRFVQERGLSGADRVRLMIDVCAAVEHAHQRGIIHRDLKPGNVLVTPAGAAKVIDFGLARVQDLSSGAKFMSTEPGFGLGTLPYASPEQVLGPSGEVDTRSDVHALGVILYETLSGRLPYETGDRGLGALLSAMASEEPVPLGRRDPAFRGDLEGIVRKATERDRERRYPSPRELAEDLRRWLAREPVMARPLGPGGRLLRWTLRHRVLAAAASIACAAVLGGAILAFIGMKRAQESEARLLVQHRDVIDVFAAQVDRIAREAHQPLSAEYRRQALGEIVAQLDAYVDRNGAVPALRAVQARAVEVLGNLELERGRPAEARAWQERALGIRRELVGFPDAAADWWIGLSMSLVKIGDLEKEERRFESAAVWYREALAIDERLAAASPGEPGLLDNLCWSCERIGYLAWIQDDLREAWSWWERRHRLSLDLLAMDRDRVPSQRNLRCSFALRMAIFRSLGLDAEAREASNESLAWARRLAGGDPEDPEQGLALAAALNSAAVLAGLSEDFAAAFELAAEAQVRADALRRVDPQNANYFRAALAARISLIRALLRKARIESGSSVPAEAIRYVSEVEDLILESGPADSRSAERDLELANLEVEMASFHLSRGFAERARASAAAAAGRFRRILDHEASGIPAHGLVLALQRAGGFGDPVPVDKLIEYVERAWSRGVRVAPIDAPAILALIQAAGRPILVREIAADVLVRIPVRPSPVRSHVDAALRE